jgi:RHS repeat-associated protein
LTTTLTYNNSNQLTKVTGPFGAVMSFTYNDSNQVATMTAPDGGVYTYTYSIYAIKYLLSVTYPDNTVRSYQYGDQFYPYALTGIVDENGNLFASWTYDYEGHATSSQHAGGADLTTVSYGINASTVTDANGNSHTYNLQTIFGVPKPVSETGAPLPSLGGDAFSYDANGFLAGMTNYDGNITTYTHDTRGDQLSRTEAYGTALARTTSTTWLSTFHLPSQIVEPTGRTTTFTYDAHGNILTKTVASGTETRVWTYTYNTAGQVLTAKDPLGHVTTYTYDAYGNIATATDALGHKTSFTAYDNAGRLLSFKDPNGLVTTLTYDARGRLLARAEGAEVTSFAYDAAGNRIKLTRPDGSYITYVYDAAHRLTQEVDALNDQMGFTLDGNSNRTNVSLYDPSANLTQTRSFGYDWVNRLIQETGAQGQQTTYTYDPEGNLTGVSDPLSHNTAFAYDALNRRVQTTDAEGGLTKFAYDPLNRLTGETDPRNLATSYAYDGLDDQTGIASPDTGTTAKTYDATGNVLTSTDARGKKTSYSYDALNRVTKAAYADGTSATYAYDQGTNGIGHLTTLTDAAGTTTWAYDQHGRVTAKTQKTGNVTLTTRYAYDAYGRLGDITYPSGKVVQLTYDAAGHINGLADNGAWIVSGVTYRPFGPANSWREGDGAAFIRAFDTDGRIAAIALGATAHDPATVTQTFTYDLASRITGMTETNQPGQAFGYDALDRLTGVAKGTGKTAQTTAYAYDLDGNRVSEIVAGEKAETTAYGYAATSNRLLQTVRTHEHDTQKAALAYDADGNLLSDDAHEWTYDAKGRMASVAPANNAAVGELGGFGGGEQPAAMQTTDYAVNGLGQRVAKHRDSGRSETGTTYVYDNAGHVLGEYDAQGHVLEETVYLGDLPVAILNGQDKGFDRDYSAVLYIASDQLGAPHLITNAQGHEVWSWHHDPFGQGTTLSTVAQADLIHYDQRFPGQVFDEESNLNNNGFRDYNPATGRYVQSDPIGLLAGVNTYGYVGANPITYSDRKGEGPEFLLPVLVGMGAIILNQTSYFIWAITPPKAPNTVPPPPTPTSANMCNAVNPYGTTMGSNGTFVYSGSPRMGSGESPEQPEDLPEMPQNPTVPSWTGGGMSYPISGR